MSGKIRAVLHGAAALALAATASGITVAPTGSIPGGSAIAFWRGSVTSSAYPPSWCTPR